MAVKKITGISRNVVVLGFVSMFTDIASEMLYPIIPLFILGVLGLPPVALGIIEGAAEGISTALRWVGGALSDRAQRRKPFVVAGYSISAVSKPVMGLAAYATGWPIFVIGRASDRLGKSARTAARDALISDSTPENFRGRAFGFHRAMDTTGAVIGPLIAVAVLVMDPAFPLAWLFFLAVAPGAISALLAATQVQDIPHAADPAAARQRMALFQRFPRPFWLLLIGGALFSLGNSSDAFLIARSAALFSGSPGASAGFPNNPAALAHVAVLAGLLFALFNIIYAAAAAPLGAWSDRIGRKPVVVTGFIIYGVVYFGFATAWSSWAPWALFASYGLYQAFTEGVLKAWISDAVPRDRRAGAIGLFYTATGLSQMAASVLTGALWNVKLFNGHVMLAFLLGTIFSLAAAAWLLAAR